MEVVCLKCGETTDVEVLTPASACPGCSAIYSKVEAVERKRKEDSAKRDARIAQRAARQQRFNAAFAPFRRVGRFTLAGAGWALKGLTFLLAPVIWFLKNLRMSESSPRSVGQKNNANATAKAAKAGIFGLFAVTAAVTATFLSFALKSPGRGRGRGKKSDSQRRTDAWYRNGD